MDTESERSCRPAEVRWRWPTPLSNNDTPSWRSNSRKDELSACRPPTEVELLGATCDIELLGDLDETLESAEIQRHDWSASAAEEMVHTRVLSATAPDLTK